MVAVVRVLGFGTYDIERHPRAGILLDGFRAAGDDVLDANAPLGFSTSERVAMLQRPWLAYRLVLRLARCWSLLIARARGLRADPKPDSVLVGYLGHFDVLLARLLFRRTTIVLDQLIFAADTADDRGLGRAGGLRRRALTLLDEAAARAADVVVVDTEENGQLLSPSLRHKAVVVAVGAGSEWFEAGARRAARPGEQPLRVVFFGAYTPLHGTDVIAAAMVGLDAEGELRLTMIGDGQRRASAQRSTENAANAHIEWIDWVPPDRLPALVAAHDVCLGIFGTGPKALRVVPNKVYQGAAAGCAIITSDTAPQRRALLGDGAVFIAPGDATALAGALRELARDRARVARLGERARTLALASYQARTVVQPLRDRLQK
jgi:glycosyltransferase involved in cell wall biosynthesis